MGLARYMSEEMSLIGSGVSISASSEMPGEVGAALKVGTGSATGISLGQYTGEPAALEYTVEIDDISAGAEVGQATFRWKTDQSSGWEATGVLTSATGTALSNGASVKFTSGAGDDFAVGDKWTFKCARFFSKERIYDLDPDTAWRSGSPISDPEYMEFDLGSSQNAKAVIIHNHNLSTAADVRLLGGKNLVTTAFASGDYGFNIHRYQNIEFSLGTVIDGQVRHQWNPYQRTLIIALKPGFAATAPTNGGDGGTETYLYDTGSECAYFDHSDARFKWERGGTAYLQSPAQTFSANDELLIYLSINYEEDSYSLKANSQTLVSDTTALTAPTSDTTLYLGQASDLTGRGACTIALWVFMEVLDKGESWFDDFYNSGTWKSITEKADAFLWACLPAPDGSSVNLLGLDWKDYDSSTNTNGCMTEDQVLEKAGTSDFTVSGATVLKDTSNPRLGAQSIKGTAAAGGASLFQFPEYSGRGDMGDEENYVQYVYFKRGGGTAANREVYWYRDGVIQWVGAYVNSASWQLIQQAFQTPTGGSNNRMVFVTHRASSGGAVGDEMFIGCIGVFPNRIDDGTFGDPNHAYVGGVAPGWTKAGSITAAEATTSRYGWSADKGQQFGAGDSSANHIYQAVSGLTAGNWHLFEGFVKRESGTGSVKIDLSGATTKVFSSTAASWEKKSLLFKAASASLTIKLYCGTGTVGTADDFSLVELDSDSASFDTWDYSLPMTYRSGSMLEYRDKSYREWRVEMSDASNAQGHLQIGEAFLGGCLELSTGAYYRGITQGRIPIEEVEQTKSGIARGTFSNLVERIAFELSLSDGDWESLRSFYGAVGSIKELWKLPFFFNRDSGETGALWLVYFREALEGRNFMGKGASSRWETALELVEAVKSQI